MTRKTQAPGADTVSDRTALGRDASTVRGANPTEEFYKAHEVHTLVQLTLQQLAASWNGASGAWGGPRAADLQTPSPNLQGIGMGWPLGGLPGGPLYPGIPQPVLYWYP